MVRMRLRVLMRLALTVVQVPLEVDSLLVVTVAPVVWAWFITASLTVVLVVLVVSVAHIQLEARVAMVVSQCLAVWTPFRSMFQHR
jgi:hypothetical protein